VDIAEIYEVMFELDKLYFGSLTYKIH